MKLLRLLINLAVTLLPWFLRALVLRCFYGYEIGTGARIGLAYVFPQKLILGEGASIGHLTVVKGLEQLSLGRNASIGRLNWITGLPAGTKHFQHVKDRRSTLTLGEEASVTHRHLIDCTHEVEIGAFTTFAGFRSQILTHSIDLVQNRQHCAPVRIGMKCFTGTGCILLAGSVLPACSVLSAGAVLTEAFSTTHRLYGGVPAKEIKPLDPTAAYFHRTNGFVD